MDVQRQDQYREQRRANRLTWERTVRITGPVQAHGRVMDASACGLLLRVERRPELHTGDWVDVEIPRAEDGAVLCRRGRIVRLALMDSDMLLGLELG